MNMRRKDTIKSDTKSARESTAKSALHNVPKIIFWITLVLSILVIIGTMHADIQGKKEFAKFSEQAIATNNPSACENINDFKYAAQCFFSFIEQGYDCPNEQDPCLLALGVYKEDEGVCDKLFYGAQTQENLECRIGVFMQRYKDEGLSDCCHFK